MVKNSRYTKVSYYLKVKFYLKKLQTQTLARLVIINILQNRFKHSCYIIPCSFYIIITIFQDKNYLYDCNLFTGDYLRYYYFQVQFYNINSSTRKSISKRCSYVFFGNHYRTHSQLATNLVIRQKRTLITANS